MGISRIRFLSCYNNSITSSFQLPYVISHPCPSTGRANIEKFQFQCFSFKHSSTLFGLLFTTPKGDTYISYIRITNDLWLLFSIQAYLPYSPKNMGKETRKWWKVWGCTRSVCRCMRQKTDASSSEYRFRTSANDADEYHKPVRSRNKRWMPRIQW